jgi:CRP/FNR family transcriptional regulator, cyclic AMP receptor protein
MIEVNAAALAAHPFLRGMSADHLDVLAEAARDVKFPARYRLFEDGGSATRFWLIQCGHVSLDLDIPGEGPVVIETIGMGELLGWSWLFPPYGWAFGAVTITAVEAFEFDAPMVRERCATEPALGYEFNQRVTRVLAKRLQATRIRLLTRAPGTAICVRW